MRKFLRPLAVLCLIAMLIALCSCGETKTQMKITVVNRTTQPIADIRISPANSDDWGSNRINETLYEGEYIELDLGSFSKEELDAGFEIQIYGEDVMPISPDYDPYTPTFFDSGDWLIFAPPETNCFMFMDTGYDAAEYDQKIAELLPDGEDGGDEVYDYTEYSGTWYSTGDYEYDYIEIDVFGEWTLYAGGEAALTGELKYEPEWESVYAYNDNDGSGCMTRLEDGELYLASYGYFSKGGADDGDTEPLDSTGLAGIWYLNGDLDAASYIRFDDLGNWELYQRESGDADGELTQSGTLSPSGMEPDTFYADADDGSISYWMCWSETDEIIWGGGMDSYIRME